MLISWRPLVRAGGRRASHTHDAGKEREMSEQANEQPVLDLLAEMTAASLERSTLDPQTLLLVRIAALVAVDAPPLSYLGNLEIAGDVGISAEDVQGVLTAVAPIVGTARVVSSASKIARALGIAVALEEDEEDEELASGE
jgi:alkylhydroperoxidase/carboxymuconolactone decarboxylase family protein YurZ